MRMSQQLVGDLPPSVGQVANLIGILGEAAAEAARSASRATFRAIDRRGAGKRLPQHAALTRSADSEAAASTPMWNTLASALDLALKQPGARARLARYLGLPRQRITDFTKKRRVPDAETALRLLHWLAATRAGHDPSYVVPAPEPTRTPERVTQ